MPKYKATLVLKAKDSPHPETISIVIDANNAIHAKELLKDQYGEASVKSVVRDDSPPKHFKGRH
jgi:hypothetical protein